MQPISRYQVRKELVGGMHVELIDVVHNLVCETCGTVLRTDIPNLPGLIAAVAIGRSKADRKLSGQEIRFLRKALDETAKELAEHLDVTEETVSRWENDRLAISNSVERMLRLRVCKVLRQKAPAMDWNDDQILYRLKIIPVGAKPLVMTFWLVSHKRQDQYREQKAA
jgi:DNA-binding XRE family transcriptional regulator